MIFLPNMREVYVADLIFVVEIYKQAAVADRNITHKKFGTKDVSRIFYTFSAKSVARPLREIS